VGIEEITAQASVALPALLSNLHFPIHQPGLNSINNKVEIWTVKYPLDKREPKIFAKTTSKFDRRELRYVMFNSPQHIS
jgi:hypothetical protein